MATTGTESSNPKFTSTTTTTATPPIEASTSIPQLPNNTPATTSDINSNNGTTSTTSNTKSSTSNTSMDSDYDPFLGLSFKVGVAENKNTTFRNKMEDVHTYIANFAERVDWGYFAIFDGHAGKDTARWCGNNLHTLLEEEIDRSTDDSSSPPTTPITGKNDLRDDLYKCFVKADELIEKSGQGKSGCTAAVAVLRWESDIDEPKQHTKTENGGKFDFRPTKNHKRMLYTSNVGDLRIVLCRAGKAYRLTYDHKATDIHEISRIEDNGGLVLKNRVNGVLAVTRSLGDTYMKQLVIGIPFTTATEITAEDEFIIIACDGVWDVMSDSHACKVVQESFRHGLGPVQVAKKLCQLAIDLSTTDNVTVMVIKLDKDVFA
ncbi:Protein phosphatase 2C 1 [Candida viswanathii]|uniref:Protein phosphatase 2C 1 n=1 Tax=Candida viswanathii TaxID=5486 RepID=A0A367YCD3_9ASCO|nr:Protein phosphatase 2C 1 [Candida viswanathii]